jgi:hypothetical protein
MIAEAMKVKNVKNWYFGLETALKLNNMTHEYFDIDFVITDSFRTTKVIKIIDRNFKFYKRSKRHLKYGILKKNNLFYSDHEKTVLDLVYNRYVNNENLEQLSAPLKEYKNKLDEDRLFDYLENYPRKFREILEGLL